MDPDAKKQSLDLALKLVNFKSVKVIYLPEGKDANGKTVVFTQNRFTMPSADVTIEVEFLVANAKTADIAIVSVSIIALLADLIVFTQYRKIKEAK